MKIGVLTSGGDAPGMNAAVRAVIRFGIHKGTQVFAIYEGYQGMIDGGSRIQQMRWRDGGDILQKGGTVIGSARCLPFRERAGRKQAAFNLLQNGIDRLVIIGGDGSLTGAQIFYEEWSGLLAELVEEGKISQKTADSHPHLYIAGLAGSIDNDLYGTDITIGADTALHRITAAVDAITSTAASHQRSFVVEVMGRRCGYLALMSGIATAADWVLIPESPPNIDNWEDKMCEVMQMGRETGRRDNIVIIAEGACDRHGTPITSDHVKQTLEEKLGEDTRITILGHVQRGGSPTAFDRNLSTLLGQDAVNAIMDAESDMEPIHVGIQGNIITRTSLKHCLDMTHEIEVAIKNQDFDRAMALRGNSFVNAFATLRTLVRAKPHEPIAGQPRRRIAVMHCGAPSPGMNTAVRAAVRLGLDRGHQMLMIHHAFRGLIRGEVEEANWMSVNGWAHLGGAMLGTNRHIPTRSELYGVARAIEEHNIEGIIMIGGWSGYEAVLKLYENREDYPAFNIPMTCLPATIDNDLPGAELSVGADTALNNIVSAVDKIKQSAVASRRVFVVEVMGRTCGYLALMSGMATGAEQIYLPEEGITLSGLQEDVQELVQGFETGKRLGLVIRNESANEVYTTDFIRRAYEEEGGELFEARQAILGHLQQGGDPTPFDRTQATRLVQECIGHLEEVIGEADAQSIAIGLTGGALQKTPLDVLPKMMDSANARPKEQWWLALRSIASVLALPINGHVEQTD